VARHDWVNMGGTIVGSLLMDKLRAVKIDQTQMKKKRQREGCMLYTHTVVQESFRFSIHFFSIFLFSAQTCNILQRCSTVCDHFVMLKSPQKQNRQFFFCF